MQEGSSRQGREERPLHTSALENREDGTTLLIMRRQLGGSGKPSNVLVAVEEDELEAER